VTVVGRGNDPRIKKQKLANVMGREPYFSGRKREGEKDVGSVGFTFRLFK
jgi:hypothetical protein